MEPTFGTLAWAQRTGGRLTPGEQLAYVRDAVTDQLARLPRQALARLGLARPPRAALGDVRVPAGALARDASELMQRTCAPWLVNHCLRAWAWAALLGRRDGVAFDAGLLYAACALHDLGLTGAFAPEPGACFAFAGARAAEDALRRAGHPAGPARTVAQAICLHLNVRVGLAAHGPEAHLLHAGTALDVLGQRLADVSPAARTHVLDTHPRLGMKQQLAVCMRQQAARSPASRGGVLYRRLPFALLVRAAPFPG